MIRVALKNILAHKVRLTALMLTIVLGVSFVAGTYVLTDTITHVFDDIFTDVYSGIDVNVRHTSALGLDAQRPPIPASVLDTVKGVPGVRAAEGSIFAIGVTIIDAKGKRVGNPQAPTFGTTWATDDALTPFTLRRGRRPTAPSEVAIDLQSFTTGKFQLGDSIQLVTAAGPQRFTLVGVAGFGQASNLAGATISIFAMTTAQQLLGRVNQFDSINVAAAPGVSAEVLQDRIAAVLDRQDEAVTSAQLTNESQRTVATALGFFRTFMLVFAFVALFVGAFIIYNTYSIVIAERTRELALVRALGASSGGVLASVLAEALITGLVASALGLLGGIGIAIGLRRLLEALQFTMPSGGLVLLPRTVWVAILGGTAIAVLAALVPATRAARVAPITAMNETGTSARSGVVRNVVGGVLALGGAAAVLVGLDKGLLALLGAGAAGVFVGAAMVAPLLSRPVVTAIGEPVEHLRGAPGLLARQNARRSPRRTAATASALMIGTALMAASLVLSRSINSSVEKAVSTGAVADLVVTTDSQIGFSTALAERIATLPDVRSVASYRLARFKIGSATKNVVGVPPTALDPTSVNQVIDVGIQAGAAVGLASDGIAVSTEVAKTHGWHVGDSITVTFPTGDQVLHVVMIYRQNTLVGDYVVGMSTFAASYAGGNDFLVLLRLADTAKLHDVQTSIATILHESYPNLKVQDRQQYIAATKARVAQLLNLITALLVLAIFIALLGVLITMLLSVSERTREIGLLRAVGMSRRQTRATIRWEAAIVSLYGALLGLVLGSFFGVVLVRALRKQGITETVVAVQPLVVLAAVIAVLGVLASVYPARRAARLNIITAVSHA